MSRKERIRDHVETIAEEVFDYIVERQGLYPDRWVPAKDIKKDLDLTRIAVPKDNDSRRATGWLFAIIARMLKDCGRLEYQKVGSRAFYRTAGSQELGE